MSIPGAPSPMKMKGQGSMSPLQGALVKQRLSGSVSQGGKMPLKRLSLRTAPKMPDLMGKRPGWM